MKFLIGIAVALGIAAVAYGAAAALNVDGGVIQYGSDTTLTCTSDTINASATTVGVTDPTIDYVSVSGDLATACVGQNIRIGLTGSDPAFNGTNGYESYNGPISGGVTCNLDPTKLCFAVNAQDPGRNAGTLTDIHLTIYSN